MFEATEADLLNDWITRLDKDAGRVRAAMSTEEIRHYAGRVLHETLTSLGGGSVSLTSALTELLSELSGNLAERGLSPSETATFVFSLKEVLFDALRKQYGGEDLATKSWAVNTAIDRLGLFTFEAFSQARERLVRSQAEAIAELSSPVIKVWDGVIALPLVGSIDSIRAKDVMETLLNAVVANEADIVIIDITGVPIVDTQVANRLMRTVEAVRLLGTKSIVTGINPIIAQTLVQLGVDLSQLSTKASLQAGLSDAFRGLGLTVTKVEKR